MMKKLLLTIIFVGPFFNTRAQNVDLSNYTDYIRIQKNGETDFSRAFGLNALNHMYIGSVEKTIGDIYFYNAGVNHLMTLKPNGYVGFGTTNPISPIQIVNDFDAILTFQTSDNNWLYTQWRDNSGTRRAWVGLDNSLTGFNINVENGTNRIILNGGDVGIGSGAPKEKLHVEGNFLLDVYNNGGNESGIFFRENFSTSDIYNLSILAYDHSNSGVSPDGLSINAFDGISFSTGSNNRNEKMRISSEGNVGIGTTNSGSWKLAVNGNIRAKEIKVETGWSDFVFENDYNLPTLEEVEQHIQEKGHLKDIPSAEEVAQNGIFLGEMDAKLLQKIEELMLYTIAQEKELDEHRKKNKELEERLARLEQSMTDARCPMKGSK